MSWRRVVLSLLLVTIVSAGCAGDGDGDAGGVSVEDPIGAPEPGSGHGAGVGPSVVKTASLQFEVAKARLSRAAQEVIDLATAPKTGGFLVSSVVDLDDGDGWANVVVEVPSPRFEQTVSALDSVGSIARQELQGQDLTDDYLAAHAAIARTRRTVAGLLRRLEGTEDRAVAFRLREELQTARVNLRELEGDESYIEGQTAFSGIDVVLAARPPAPVEKSALEQAFDTARGLSVLIASAVVIALGAVLPIGAALLVVYAAVIVVVRRLRPRLDS